MGLPPAGTKMLLWKTSMIKPAISTHIPSKIESVIDQLYSNASDKFLRSAISRDEGMFLRDLASRPDVRRTIEVGCANGMSALYICAGIDGKPDATHTAIDPFQTSEFERRGCDNLRRAGISCFQLLEEPSEFALPAYLRGGASFDMAFIDGLHTADQTLLDFYFVDRMIRPGGIVVFDDVNAAAVNKVVRYVSTYPDYRLIGTAGRRGLQRRIINVVKQILSIALWPVREILGEALCREFLDVSLIRSEKLWTIDSCTMAAFQKVGTYERDTDWFRGI